MNISKFLRIVFLYNTTGGCFWQSYHSIVKPAGAPVLWFRASTCFNFGQKFSWNFAQMIFYYHMTNQFLPCFMWLVACFWFQNMFWKNINCFQFWRKTYTGRCTSNYVISRVKTFFPYLTVGQVLSVSGYDLKKGTSWWKSRFWFCSSFFTLLSLFTVSVCLCLLCLLSCLCCSCKLF